MFSTQNRIVSLFILSMSVSFLFSESMARGLLRSSNILPADIYENQWALIIGINQYTDFEPKLKWAVEDAKSIKTTLMTQYGFPEQNIEMLTDSDATKDGIQNAFYNLVEKTKKEDAVVIFFAGHGTTRKNPGSNEDLGYLIPVDGKDDNLTRSTLSMKTINTMSNEIPAKSVLFLVDACYGGLAASGQYRSDRELDIVRGLTKDRSRLIITAGKKNEEVVENEKWGHSAFTSVLLDGLQDLQADTDKDGIILANQLYSYIQSNVLKLTDGGQTPQFNQLTSDEGEFAFIDQNIISDIYDAVISGFGFLTIPSGPSEALIKVDDHLIDKKTPLISETLEAGYHTITISKKGYKDFADRIFIKPNLTTTITPIMNLIEGIVSFANMPNLSKVSINGQLIGSTPLENYVLEKGQYTIEVNIPGYEKLPPIDLNIENSNVYPLTLPRLVPKTKMKAFMRSAIMPGWGQNYYEQPKKSIAFGSAAILSGLYVLYNQLQYNQLTTDYNTAVMDYNTTLVDHDYKRDHMYSLYEKLQANQNNTNISIMLLGGIYAINLLDISISNPFYDRTYSEHDSGPEVKVGFMPVSPGVQLKVEF